MIILIECLIWTDKFQAQERGPSIVRGMHNKSGGKAVIIIIIALLCVFYSECVCLASFKQNKEIARERERMDMNSPWTDRFLAALSGEESRKEPNDLEV